MDSKNSQNQEELQDMSEFIDIILDEGDSSKSTEKLFSELETYEQ